MFNPTGRKGHKERGPRSRRLWSLSAPRQWPQSELARTGRRSSAAHKPASVGGSDLREPPVTLGGFRLSLPTGSGASYRQVGDSRASQARGQGRVTHLSSLPGAAAHSPTHSSLLCAVTGTVALPSKTQTNCPPHKALDGVGSDHMSGSSTPRQVRTQGMTMGNSPNHPCLVGEESATDVPKGSSSFPLF